MKVFLSILLGLVTMGYAVYGNEQPPGQKPPPPSPPRPAVVPQYARPAYAPPQYFQPAPGYAPGAVPGAYGRRPSHYFVSLADYARIPGPHITSVTGFLPVAAQTVVIRGSGFGNFQPFEGDVPFFMITDVTRGWNAGSNRAGNQDAITVRISRWSDNEIDFAGFSGAYGGNWRLAPGDQVAVYVWNSANGYGAAVRIAAIRTLVWPEPQPAAATEPSSSTAPVAYNPSAPTLNPAVPPTSWLRIVSGTGSFASITAAEKSIQVHPGDPLSGTVQFHAMNAASQPPPAWMVFTPNWGAPADSWQTVDQRPLPSQQSVQRANVALAAPTEPGTYYLVFAFTQEHDAAHVAARTSSDAGAPRWNLALATLQASELTEAQQTGQTTCEWQAISGTKQRSMALDAVTIDVVPDSGTKPPPQQADLSELPQTVAMDNASDLPPVAVDLN